MSDSVQRKKRPELFFGFVAAPNAPVAKVAKRTSSLGVSSRPLRQRPIGADLSSTIETFCEYFVRRGYRVVELKVTDVFDVFEKYIPPKEPLVRHRNERERYRTFIAYGNQLREQFGDAMLAATAIRRVMRERLRRSKKTSPESHFEGTAYFIHQFKRREEIDLLRSVYGRIFFQVSIYSRRGARVDYLSRKFASGNHVAGPQKIIAMQPKPSSSKMKMRKAKNTVNVLATSFMTPT